eukprot:431618-Prymnesium_polylepis.2
MRRMCAAYIRPSWKSTRTHTRYWCASTCGIRTNRFRRRGLRVETCCPQLDPILNRRSRGMDPGRAAND